MYKRILLHIIYWTLAWALTHVLFGYGELFNPSSLAYSSFILMVAAGVSYFISYLLIPRYLQKGKYGLFAAYLIFTIIISLNIEILTTMLFIVFLEKFIVRVFFDDIREIYSLLTGTYFIVFLSVAIRLVEIWFGEQKRKQEALQEKVEAELKLLKSQIHPHFLFNTLNNIYSLSLKKSDQAPDAVIKLSEMLDYLIYQGESEMVSLEKEAELLNNYIELEKLRYGERLNVDFRIEGDPLSLRIAPLLLIPLVENAFKHGISRSRDSHELIIRLGISGKKLEFYVENSITPDVNDKTNGGRGLPNLRARLELLYREKHFLETREENKRFIALLKIET